MKQAVSWVELLRRPQVSILEIIKLGDGKLDFSQEVLEELEIEVKYEGFIRRQKEEVERFNRIDKVKIPEGRRNCVS